MITGMEPLRLMRADVVCVKTNSFLGWLIRAISCGMVNHVGLIASDGFLETVEIIEALHKVKRHNFFWRYVERNAEIAVFRPKGLSDIQRQMIVARAKHYVDADYDYLQLIAHFLDWLLFGAYFFRRFTDDDNYPICSWIVVEAFSTVNVGFGVSRGMARPSDIWDYMRGQEGKEFEQVVQLKHIRMI